MYSDLTRVNLYTGNNRIENNVSVTDVYPIDSFSKSVAWKNWENKSNRNHIAVKNLFHSAQFLFIEQRNNGGLAFKVAVDVLLEDNTVLKAYVDMKKNEFMKQVNQEGILPSGKMENVFMFYKNNLIIAPDDYIKNFNEYDEKNYEKYLNEKDNYKNVIGKNKAEYGIYTKAVKNKLDGHAYLVTYIPHYTLNQYSSKEIKLSLIFKIENTDASDKELVLEKFNNMTLDEKIKCSNLYLNFSESLCEQKYNLSDEEVDEIMGQFSFDIQENYSSVIQECKDNQDFEYLAKYNKLVFCSISNYCSEKSYNLQENTEELMFELIKFIMLNPHHEIKVETLKLYLRHS